MTPGPLSPQCVRTKAGLSKTRTFNELSYSGHSASNSVPFGDVVENFNAF